MCLQSITRAHFWLLITPGETHRPQKNKSQISQEQCPSLPHFEWLRGHPALRTWVWENSIPKKSCFWIFSLVSTDISLLIQMQSPQSPLPKAAYCESEKWLDHYEVQCGNIYKNYKCFYELSSTTSGNWLFKYICTYMKRCYVQSYLLKNH